MARYYFLCSALPPLDRRVPPPLSTHELQEQFKVGLTIHDQKQFEIILRYVDIVAIVAFFVGDFPDTRGHFSSKEEILSAIEMKSNLPDYVVDFLERYPNPKERARFSSELFTLFFAHEIANAEGVLKEYLLFERQIRLILAAWRAKKYGKDLSVEFQFEDPQDPFIAELLLQKDMSHFVFPYEYEDLTEVTAYILDPKKVWYKFLEYKYDKLELFAERNPFSLDVLLMYFLRLMIVEDLHHLNHTRGKEWINRITKEDKHVK